jgi:hypothetical protein
MNDSRSLMGRAIGKSEHQTKNIQHGSFSAKTARKRKGKYFRTGKSEPRVYRRGWRPKAQSLWIRGLYGDRQTLTPHERRPLDGNLEFLLLQHPNAPSGRLPHRPLLLFDLELTSSQSPKIVMRGIKPKCLDFALVQFYRSVHWNNGAR